MPRPRKVSVACPRSRPEEACRLPPGVRFCVVHAEESREPVARILVRDGQLFWVVAGEDGREIGGYTYIAVIARAGGLEPIELEGDVEMRVRHDKDGPKPCYQVRGRDKQLYEMPAEALVDAGFDGRETIECRLFDRGVG